MEILSTYRLQLNGGFTFRRAQAIVPYLDELGISHCYTSPFFKARPGSSHGYDIVDPNRINPEIGSEKEFNEFLVTLEHHGLGLIIDIVPNHMGVMGGDNNWWLDVLEHGQAAVHAPFFDIDWRPVKEGLRRKVLVPILGDYYGNEMEKSRLSLKFDPETGGFAVTYYEHLLPLDPRTYPLVLRKLTTAMEADSGAGEEEVTALQLLLRDFFQIPSRIELSAPKRKIRSRRSLELKRKLAEMHRHSSRLRDHLLQVVDYINRTPTLLHQILERQAYRPAFWRVASHEINYRRFFDINDLAGLNMENEKVFADTHRLVLELVGSRKVSGIRVDHPDGLYDPEGYFNRLRDSIKVGKSRDAKDATSGEPYIVVEKILAAGEKLPAGWPVQGTTGYDFAFHVNGLFIDGDAEETVSAAYREFVGEAESDFVESAYGCKKKIMQLSLASELNVLANRLDRLSEADWHTRDFTLYSLRQALEEIVACFPVYRTYQGRGHFSGADKEFVTTAVEEAKRKTTTVEKSVIDFIGRMLLFNIRPELGTGYRRQVIDFGRRFQQFTAPVMAKGIEDTAFYVYNRLLSLNEVGSEPGHFGVGVADFHRHNQDQLSSWPRTMLTTSTHDTKRSEDVRARLNVLSELAGQWRETVRHWGRLNRNKKVHVNDTAVPTANDEYHLYQILLGIWPSPEDREADLPEIIRRSKEYMRKAIREAKVHTSWKNPDERYEDGVLQFIDSIMADEQSEFRREFRRMHAVVATFGRFNSLSQNLLKFTAPGIPDIYQGMEVFNFCLVDPDNRRPVDFKAREEKLQKLAATFKDENCPGEDALPAANDPDAVKLYLTWRCLRLRRHLPQLFLKGEYLPLQVRGKKAKHLCCFLRQYDRQAILVLAPRLFYLLVDKDESRLPLGEVWGDTAVELPKETGGPLLKSVLSGAEVRLKEEGQGVLLPAARALERFPVELYVLRR